MSITVIRRAVFRGRVQGVGFRDYVERQATRNEIEGWVRNRRDGSVEAIFAGPSERVELVLGACSRGPRSARVDGVDVTEAAESELALRPGGARFVTLPTI